MSDNVVQINKDKETEIVFDVDIKGPEKLISNVSVRFLIKDVKDNMDCIFKASKQENNQWKVIIPQCEFFEKNEYSFVIEVLIEDYYFKAAEGKVEIINKLEVTINKEEKIKENLTETKQEFPGQPHPNNNLLSPEIKPKETHIEKQEKTKNIKDISSKIVPGEGPSQPENTSAEIKRGIIFKRVKKGKPVIEDIEKLRLLKEQKKQLEIKRKEKSKKVKEILRGII